MNAREMGCDMANAAVAGVCCNKLESLIELTPAATIEWNLERQVVEWNPAAERVFEYARWQALGRRLDDELIVPKEGLPLALATWQQVVGEGRNVHIVGENTTRSGRRVQCAWYLAPLFDGQGRVAGVLSVAQDVTALEDYRRRLHSLSFFDTLTGLPNRALFNDRIRQAVSQSQREQRATGLMVLGVDRFKAVNDALGHAAGDEILREVAGRLQGCVRGYDTVARFGGDAFAIVLPNIRQGTDLAPIARTILASFVEPFRAGDSQLFVSASIGIALHPQDTDDVDQLVSFGDAAMFAAKERGRGSFQFYSADLTDRAMERLYLEAGLRQALEREELEIYYQPQTDLASGRIVGVEALLRWQHPVRGLVMPDKFIAIAEETGLIVPIGLWVLRQACQAARAWRDAGCEITVAVNLSPRQFVEASLVDDVADALRQSGCKPSWLELEITESLLLEDGPHVRRALDQLTAMGITIAIDDFGTGYSALAYINRFPLATLKIDRAFVRDVVVDPDSAALARAIATMARSLRLRVVAEGVETDAQESFLKASGCQVAQGYFYGRPMPRREIDQVLLPPS
ncbi:MAG TPA: EAL domain-containing protein [Rhodocyclaceae bacterium]|nr:EAL domain-containing protein [Rhodocyclaceae bacterium]